MSDNAELPVPKVRANRNRAKRRFSRTRLPTPPPDPKVYAELLEQCGSAEEATSEREKEFLEYISSLQKPHHLPSSRSESLFEPINVTEDAFDHLDKLYKLMEQMLNLRQQNARLLRRVRDLEHLKNLESLHKQISNVAVFEDIPELDDDSSFAESLLDAMLTGTKKDPKPKPWNRSRLRQSLMRKQRNRSSSLNERAVPFDIDHLQDRRRSSAESERDKSSNKVSKWTKVKAAFRWEKASPSVSGAKSQDSGIGGMLPVNYEVARYLRVPSTSDEPGISPADSGAADGSTPGTLSSASSADDIHRAEHRRVHGDLQCSDDDHNSIILDGTHHTKSAISSDTTRPAWVKMRTKTPSCCNVSEKHRFSSRSDDMKMDISDNDDSLEYGQDEEAKPIKPNTNVRHHPEIPEAVIARYQEAIAEEERTSKHNVGPKRISKWTRVKKAFLTPSTTNIAGSKDKTNHTSTPLILDSHKEGHRYGDESKRLHDEIQRNYRQLQKKLSLEFQGKLQEWEKLKSTGPGNIAGAHARSDGSSDDQRDQEFIKKMEEWQRMKSQPSKSDQKVQMIREENLAPEFKKKLEEWQKIKKCATKDDSSPVSKSKKKLGEWPKWKSVSGHREESASMETQPLSEEFLKKLEEWRKMKRHDDMKEKTPSPKEVRKATAEPSTSGQGRKVKDQDDKELHWFDKELDKIEKQKQRLEQERQKFLQREERLTKLRRTVMGDGNKKDILIHTPSGFYRFEGISRKFTQKLCEWEKAQGIGPEASTFALLTSTFTPHITVDLYETSPQVQATQYGNARLLRSKSAESIATANLIEPCPSTSHHPSSLSLNDVDELEKQCLSLSRSSSAQDIEGSFEKLKNDEPEAVIVEFEDVVEETASPLEERLQEKHFPIYQRQMALNTCEKQPSIIPYLQRTDSKGAQYSCFLIEEIIKLLKIILDDENTWEDEYADSKFCETDKEDEHDEFEQLTPSPDVLKLKNKNEMQKQRSDTVLEKIIRLQEIHYKNISDVAVDEVAPTSSHFSNLLEAAQDLFSELFQLTELLQNFFDSRCEENDSYFNFTDSQYSGITSITSELTTKLIELKRILTYFYAASDMTAPGRKFKSTRKPRQEQTGTLAKVDELKKCSSTSDIANITYNHSPQAQLVAKRIRYKQKDYSSKTLHDNDESNTNDFASKNDSSTNRQVLEAVTVDPVIIEKLVIPTKTNYVNIACEPACASIAEATSVEVFVKTTRKLFTPVVKSQSSQCLSQSPSNSSVDLNITNSEDTVQKESSYHDVDQAARLPPLPASPTPQRKASKEISPSIRIMLAKYNQMISKQDAPGTTKSAGNSGSASPVAWRSPVSERRVKAQRERYLEEISKREVRKSASVSILNSHKITPMKSQSCSVSVLPNESELKISQGILRSTSASAIRSSTENVDQAQKHPPLKLVIPETIETPRPSPEMRYSKIQKAKEEFLNFSSVLPPVSAPPVLPGEQEIIMKYPVRSRFSQISMGSESSCDSSPPEGLLIKSASAGMINVDEDTYKQIDPAFHIEGYVSLPRSVAKQKEGLLGGKLSLSNIAAKFRKVKMRRTKEQKKMNTISALCRQSLVVDINQESSSQEKQTRSDSLTVPADRGASSSEDTSPSSSRSGSWIRRSRIFKAL